MSLDLSPLFLFFSPFPLLSFSLSLSRSLSRSLSLPLPLFSSLSSFIVRLLPSSWPMAATCQWLPSATNGFPSSSPS
jgi:hypothetical protein